MTAFAALDPALDDLKRRLAELERLEARYRGLVDRLADSENRFRSLVENMRGILFYRGEVDGRVHVFGAEIGAIAGTSALASGELDAADWYDRIHPEDLPHYLALEQRRRDTGQGFTVEFRYAGPDGEYAWARERGYTVTVPGSGRRLRDGYIIQISEEKTVEETLRRALAGAEAAQRARAGFVANVTHELRTPLNAIIGFAELMHAELFGPLGHAHYSEYLGDILMSGRHLQQLVDDLLDFSKAESGTLMLAEEAVDPSLVIDRACRMVRPRAEAGGLGLEQDLPERLPQVRADQRKLLQVVLNLLSNAIKFSEPGGRIVVAGARGADGGLTLAIRDTGIGMDQADIPRAFEPFVQLDSGHGRRYEGTGLGLPLTRTLVELHGGRLELESHPGTGTTATVHLPADRVLQP